jgi:hypothetical protein
LAKHQSWKDHAMTDENKRNLEYFEATSMRELFKLLRGWQNDNGQRFLSVAIENDRGNFCCIALTNPLEVIICAGEYKGQARVDDSGYLFVNSVLGERH